jgi:hypothetical protein
MPFLHEDLHRDNVRFPYLRAVELDTSQLNWTPLAIDSVVGCEGAKNSVRSRCQFGRIYRWS